MKPDSKIYVAGHRGMVGAAVVRRLQAIGQTHLLLRTRAELDLREQASVRDFLLAERPDVVVVAAARVGGIHANNTYPAEFLYENLASATNLIEAARQAQVPRLLFLGSSCIYPRQAAQPMMEDCLLTGPLEKTNEAYALAKIAALKMCAYYRQQYGLMYHSAMPTNLYGPGDNYHPDNSHVLPALLRRFHEAKLNGAESVTLWGTGTPRREFLHVDDLASALVELLSVENPPDWINVGSGSDVTIRELAEIIQRVVGFEGELKWDSSKPDGTPRKWMDSSKMLALGWKPQYDLESGIRQAYESFQAQIRDGEVREA